jgi:hypothetical protein
MRSIYVMVLGHGQSRVGIALIIQHGLRRWFDLCRNNSLLRGSHCMASASLDSPALSAQESERFALHRHRYGIAFERRNWGTGRLTGRDGARPDRIRGLLTPRSRIARRHTSMKSATLHRTASARPDAAPRELAAGGCQASGPRTIRRLTAYDAMRSA